MNISSLVLSHRLPGQLPRFSGDAASGNDERSALPFELRTLRPTVSLVRTTGTLEALLAQSALDRFTAAPAAAADQAR